MTVAANDRLTGPYNGNGVTTAFAYDYRIESNAELRVILRDEDGVDTTQTLTTHYTVSGVGVDGGGNVTFVTAPATGEVVIIEGVKPKTQTVEYTNGDRFPYASHQAGIDKLAVIDQEQQRDIDRTLKVPHGDTADTRLPLQADRAGKLFSWDADGNPEALATTDGIATLIALSDEVAALAAISDDVSAVAAIDAEIIAVAGSLDDITTVAGALDGVTDLAVAITAAEDAQAAAEVAETNALRAAAEARVARAGVTLLLEAAEIGAQILLAADDDGFAADFTYATDSKRLATKVDGVITEGGPDSLFTNGSNTPTRIRDENGNWAWSPHNLFLNSDAPATQNITVISGEQYTISVVGSGDITVSGAGSGTATAGSPVTITASTTTLTCTKTGTLTRAQVNRGATATAYLATTGSIRMGLPISRHPDTGEMCLLCEPNRTNSLLNSTAPATQTVSLAAGTYTLWIEGAGSVALSGGPTGTATEGSPVTFVLGGTTSVTFTKTGTVSFFQCENGANVTSQIITFGAARSRSLDNIALPLASLPALGSEWLFYFDCIPEAVGSASNYFLNINNGTGLANYTSLRSDGLLKHQLASSTIFSTTLNQTPVAGERYQLTVRMKADSIVASVQGAPPGGPGCKTGALFAPTSVSLGDWFNTSAPGQLFVRRFAILPVVDMKAADVPAWAYAHETESRLYDIFVLAGQSNVYSGETIDGGIDVSGGRVFQYEQDGALSAADEPLDQPVPLATAIGFGLPFARDYYLPAGPAPRRNIILLPCGVGNTGFMDDRWNPGDDLFNLTCGMVGSCLAKYPNARLQAILWMQGEREAQVPWTENQYATALDAMIAAFRVELGEVPFIVGGMRPGWLAADATRQPVQDALEDAPNRNYLVAYADPGTIGTTGSGVHYTAAEQRQFGEKWWDAWQTL